MYQDLGELRPVSPELSRNTGRWPSPQGARAVITSTFGRLTRHSTCEGRLAAVVSARFQAHLDRLNIYQIARQKMVRRRA